MLWGSCYDVRALRFRVWVMGLGLGLRLGVG